MRSRVARALMAAGLVLVVAGLGIYALSVWLNQPGAGHSVLSREARAIVDEAIATGPPGAVRVHSRTSLQQGAGRRTWTQSEFVLDVTPEEAGPLRARLVQLAMPLHLRVVDEGEGRTNGVPTRQWALRQDGAALVRIVVRMQPPRQPIVAEGPGPQAPPEGAAASGAGTGPDASPWRRQPIRPCPPQVAIVIDDIGYVRSTAVAFLAFDRPLTLAVFPNLEHSMEIAEAARERGREIIMHLPMESTATRVNPGTLRADMSESELAHHWETAANSLPGLVGVNNHQGSVMTADPVAMERILTRIHADHLYFLDSRTTPATVARAIAERLGMRTNENDLFLDNVKDVEYIRQKCRDLLALALVQGSAIGIGHAHPATLQALQEILPEYDAAGVQLVYLSALAD